MDEDIPNVGDNKIVTQMGTITHANGEVEKREIEFQRTRNANGGVDVTCFMPMLTLSAKKGN